MSSKTQYKLLGFVIVLAVFFLVSGSDLHSGFVWRLMLVYTAGAAIAFWAGREPIGTFRPITMAPICIALGSLMMLWALFMAVSVKHVKHSSESQPSQIRKLGSDLDAKADLQSVLQRTGFRQGRAHVLRGDWPPLPRPA